MPLSVNSKAAAVTAAVKNTQFSPAARVVPRKILIIGTYDPTITTITDEVPIQIFSPEDCGAKTGFGFMLHRLALAAFSGSQGIEAWISPQSEAGGAAASTGDIDFTGSTGVLAGTLSLYVAGQVVPVTITKAMTADEIATAVVAAITADTTLPVTATVNGVTTAQVDFTAKSKGPWGDKITLTFNQNDGEETPSGITYAITAMSSGSGTPDIQDALDGLGTGDDANENFFTDVVHGYLQDSTTLDAISTYVGEGNTEVGLYDGLVARPFRSLGGDTVADTAGLTALIAVGNGRKLDRANGIVAVPGSPNHPSEIAAVAIGVMAKINNNRAQENYLDVVLPGIIPGAKADRWTSEYNNRNSAVNAGISPTMIKNGAVVLQNVLSFYHPDDVSPDSNGYASMRNISITQNVLDNVKALFSQENFKGVSIVADISKVSSSIDKSKAIDTNKVKDYWFVLLKSFEKKSWIYDASYSIEQLGNADAVTIRSGTTGFDSNISLIYSGEGLIFNNLVLFDTSIAILG